MNKMNKKGFTLVELLVVIVIIGLLSTLAIVALNSARAKARDAKRVSDIKQLQTAYELYFNDQNKYPPAATAIVLGEGTDCGTSQACDNLCNNATGFEYNTCSSGEVLMALVPKDPDPAASGGSGTYVHTSATDAAYSIVFTLEGTVGGLSGTCTANQSGITC